MPSESTPPLDRNEWRARHLMLIAFPVESALTQDQNWWTELTGNQPETSVRKPQGREDAGTFGDVAVSLEIDPFRVKWTLAPKVDVDNLPDTVPTLGPVFGRRDWLVELMGRWIQHCPPIKRLAFAGNLVQLVANRDEAYGRLNSYLHGVNVSADTSDFMYRLNRRRNTATGIQGLVVNRLCTWYAVKISFGLHAVSLGSGESRDVQIQPEQDAAVLDLDINTIPEFSTADLSRDQLRRVFAELVDIGLQAAEQGDVP